MQVPSARIDAQFRPTAAWETLCQRAALLRQLRAFFHEHDFVEVETPLISHEWIAESHVDPIPAAYGWLQTSPEAHMKRLLAAFACSGVEAIYQVTRSFRAGERGQIHNPEFTIVEWYRLGDTMLAGIDFLDQLCQVVLNAPPAVRTAYGDAFIRHVGIDPHGATTNELAAAVRQYALDPPVGIEASDRDAWMEFLLVRQVEPRLGRQGPEILYDYPASQAALAALRHEPGQSPVAERFELYWRGIELANGYRELTDPVELRQRLAQAASIRRKAGKEPLGEATSFLAAMQAGCPACTGVALGFDRLAMLATGSPSLDAVLTFPAERA